MDFANFFAIQLLLKPSCENCYGEIFKKPHFLTGFKIKLCVVHYRSKFWSEYFFSMVQSILQANVLF